MAAGVCVRHALAENGASGSTRTWGKSAQRQLSGSVSIGYPFICLSGDTVLNESDWETLLARIKDGRCTPFLGAAVNSGFLPLGGEIATEWAKSLDYPLGSNKDLAKVSQFLAVQTDATRPKESMLAKLAKLRKEFDFDDVDEPLNVLAKLPLPGVPRIQWIPSLPLLASWP